MTEVQKFNIAQLRYEEAFYFLIRISREASLHLNKEGDSEYVAPFNDAVTAFDLVLNINTDNPFSSDVKAAIEKTDSTWRGMRNSVKGLLNFPDAAKAAIAKDAFEIIERYGDITHMSQDERYGSSYNLCQELRLLPNASRQFLNLDIWLTELEQSNDNYTVAYDAYSEEELKHVKGITKQRRKEADAAYKALIKRVNAIEEVYNDGRHAEFIKNVNFIIDKEKTKLATRHTRAENEKDIPTDGDTSDPDLPAGF